LEKDFEDVVENEDNETVTSTEEVNEFDLSIKTYPNPFVENLTIEIPSEKVSAQAELDIQIFDMRGQLVKQTKDMKLEDSVYTFFWDDLEELESGMYLIRIRVGDNIVFKKVILM